MFKKSYAKRHSWRISFRAATPVANWRSGSAAYDYDVYCVEIFTVFRDVRGSFWHFSPRMRRPSISVESLCYLCGRFFGRVLLRLRPPDLRASPDFVLSSAAVRVAVQGALKNATQKITELTGGCISHSTGACQVS